METSMILSNIQRIVKVFLFSSFTNEFDFSLFKENETVKKDLFDRSAKIEELNSKISDLLDRNQK